MERPGLGCLLARRFHPTSEGHVRLTRGQRPRQHAITHAASFPHCLPASGRFGSLSLVTPDEGAHTALLSSSSPNAVSPARANAQCFPRAAREQVLATRVIDCSLRSESGTERERERQIRCPQFLDRPPYGQARSEERRKSRSRAEPYLRRAFATRGTWTGPPHRHAFDVLKKLPAAWWHLSGALSV